MTTRTKLFRRGLAACATVISLLGAAACGGNPPPVVQVPPPPSELVVLAVDPDTGAVGMLDVADGTARLQLTEAGTGVSTSPVGLGPIVAVSQAEIARQFGDVVSALPPPAALFNLYFETGGNNLTAQSAAALPTVLAAVGQRQAPAVSVIGHTDSAGDAAANAALGLRRATLVRDLLLQAGLSPGLVEVASHGETDPLVPTPDNSNEPMNRRVEVTVR